MKRERTHEETSDARLWALCAPQILPLIERRRKVAFERLCAKHREGNSTDYVALVAELSVLRDLEWEITQKANELTATKGK